MKSKKILSVLMMTALTSLAVVGCKGGDKTSSTSTASQSTSTSQSENWKITLDHNIYLKGQDIVVKSVEKWSAALNAFQPVESYSISYDKEATGEVEVTLVAGMSRTTFTVTVYETAEEAAAAHTYYSEDKVDGLNLDRVYNYDTHKVRFGDHYEEVIDGVNRGLKVLNSSTARITAINQEVTPAVWIADEETGVKAKRDETKYSVPHTMFSTNAEGVKVTYKTYAAYEAARWSVEMIFDGTGRLCYFIYCFPANEWTGRVGHPDTNNWYSHSDFADLTKNPAFILGGEYTEQNEQGEEVTLGADYWQFTENGEIAIDAETGERIVANRDEYEKVIPEGGFYLIAPGGDGNIVSKIWQKMSGEDTTVTDETATTIFNQEISRANERLEGSRCFFNEDTKEIDIYNEATEKQYYAYYLSKTDEGNYTDLQHYADEVVKLLVEMTNPLVEEEPVLADYYDEKIDSVFAEWKTALDGKAA